MDSRYSPITAVALALSFRESARVLGIDRGQTLHQLIRAGRLKPVAWGKRQRIPLEQLQQVAREGFQTAGAKPRPSHQRRKGHADPAALRKLDLDGLSGVRHE